MIQNIVSDNTEDACSGVDVFLQNIRNLAGQQITQNSAAHTRDQTHKCDQQKLICIQKTDGCFHTEDCKCCKSEGVRQKQQVVVHNIGTAGEFAIGTNTTAYRMAKEYQIGAKLPILIAEKTGPHFAVGDTCYSHAEDTVVYNPNGKEIIARDNEKSLLRKEDMSKAYFNCHTDITIPYDELGSIRVQTAEGKELSIIEGGRFVLPGTEVLNEPLDQENA